MNEENEEINAEEQLDDLPFYIQDIIKDCTLDKKEINNKQLISKNETEHQEINNKLTNNLKNNEKHEQEQEQKQEKEKEKISIPESNNETTPIKSENPNKNNNNNNNNTAYTTPNKTPISKENDTTPSVNNSSNITISDKKIIPPFSIKDEIVNNQNELDYNEENNQNFQENNFQDISLDNINYDFNINPFMNTDSKENNGIKVYNIQEAELLNIKRSYRLQSILQNNYMGYKSNTYECTICFKRIQNYGLLSNCDDVFCYDCIKQWRTEAISKNKREMFRRCPICNCESPMLIKSKTYACGEEKKKKFNDLKQEKKNNQSNNFINKLELK